MKRTFPFIIAMLGVVSLIVMSNIFADKGQVSSYELNNISNQQEGLPAALKETIAITQEKEKASLEEELGITIEGDLDIVHLSFGSFYTLTYSRNGDFVVIVDDSSREAEARNAVTAWFASKGVNDLSKLNIIWNIKPPNLYEQGSNTLFIKSPPNGGF